MKVKVLSLILSLVLITGTGLVMAGCAEEEVAPPPPTEEVAPPIVLKFGGSFGDPDTSPMCLAEKKYFDEMERRCGGKIKMEYYWHGVLGKKEAQYYAVLGNVQQLALISPGYIAGMFPLIRVCGVPYAGIKNGIQGSYALDALREEYLEAEFPGVKLLCAFVQGPREFGFTDRPVYTMEDMAGRKLRVNPGMAEEATKALGAVPTYVPVPEWYSATATGLLDGALAPVPPMIDFKLQELFKYITISHFGYMPYAVIMNLEAWNSLPPDVQQIWEEGSSYGLELMGGLYDELTAGSLAEFVEMGAEIYELPPEELARWQAACAPVADEWAEEMNAEGLPGTEVLWFFRQNLKRYAIELGLE